MKRKEYYDGRTLFSIQYEASNMFRKGHNLKLACTPLPFLLQDYKTILAAATYFRSIFNKVTSNEESEYYLYIHTILLKISSRFSNKPSEFGRKDFVRYISI